jgi:hypothetical protein
MQLVILSLTPLQKRNATLRQSVYGMAVDTIDKYLKLKKLGL